MKNEGEQIIESVEKIYWQLKKDFPDMDEHWYLANTWLKRYKDTEAGKEKGKGLMNSISYQDTFSFSVLDSPKSIRAFAFFLLYKEGLKEAEEHVYEFEEITKELEKYQENNTFFPVYKQKNPKTYEKAQIKNDSDFEGALNLYWLVKGFESVYKNPEKNNQHKSFKPLSKDQIKEMKKKIEDCSNLEINQNKKDWDHFKFSFLIIFFLVFLIPDFGGRIIDNSNVSIESSSSLIYFLATIFLSIGIITISLALIILIGRYAYKITNRKHFMLLGLCGFSYLLSVLAFFVLWKLKSERLKEIKREINESV